MPEKRKKLALVVKGGTFDNLYAAFILASSAVAMDMEAHLYFTLHAHAIRLGC